MKKGLSTSVIVAWLMVIWLPTSAAGLNSGTASTGGVWSDFDGDGFADLAVGVPGEDVGTISDAGAVNVIYGGPTGLTAAGNQRWTQHSTGIRDTHEPGDQFGSALTAGDFNGDSFDDLVVGVPGEDVGTVTNAGAVNVIYGSPGGLTAGGNQLWTADSPGILGGGGNFGGALAAGNFGRGLPADLAVGGPAGDGAVTIIYGSLAGLAATGNQLWTAASLGIPPGGEEPQHFGFALATASFGKGLLADLAIGLPGQDVGPCTSPADCSFDAGAVSVIYGSSSGLTAAGSQRWTQDSPGILGTSGEGDLFGWALAAGNLGRGLQAELAVGGNNVDAPGEVSVIYGSPSGGLTAAGDQLWTQDSPGILDIGEEADAFGCALAAGNFGKGSQADLAIGVPFEDVGTIEDAGAVNVLYGSVSGLSSAGDQLWHQNSPGIADVAERSDGFGWTLAGANLGKSGLADLSVGVPRETIGTITHAGSVNVIYGSASGLSPTGDQLWHQNSPAIVGGAEAFDNFGWTLGQGCLPTEQFFE